MSDRVEIEKLLTDVRLRRDEAEARATKAAETLARSASGLTPLADVDADEVQATADAFAAAVRELHRLDQFARELRGLLM